jgi:hypothetical protein
LFSVTINIEFVIYHELDVVLDEHLDVFLYRDSKADNDTLDNGVHQEHAHRDNKLNMLVGTFLHHFGDLDTLRYQLALKKDKVR